MGWFVESRGETSGQERRVEQKPVWAEGKEETGGSMRLVWTILRLLKPSLKSCFAGCWVSVYKRGAITSGCQNTELPERDSEGIGNSGKIARWEG